MPQVIVDPDEVENFNRDLAEIANAIEERRSALRGTFESLSEVWRDDKYIQFADLFAETLSGIEQFLRQVEEYGIYLDRKVRPVYEYLGRQIGP